MNFINLFFLVGFSSSANMAGFLKKCMPRRRSFSILKFIIFTGFCWFIIDIGFKQDSASDFGEMLDRNQIESFKDEFKVVKSDVDGTQLDPFGRSILDEFLKKMEDVKNKASSNLFNKNKMEGIAPVTKEPGPVKDEPVLVKDEPAPVKDEPAPVKDQPAPVKDEPAPVKDELAPIKDEPAPIKDEPAPIKDEPAPAPVKNEPAPVKDEPAPVKDQPAPVKDEPKVEIAPVNNEPEKGVFVSPPNIFNATDLGEMGRGVDLPATIPENIQDIVSEGWRLHEFNQYVSDLISVHRSLPDSRDDYCKQKDLYLAKLPATSIIIIFHNEAWSTLLRSVHSVIDRSPDHLIEEIILVDDCSDMGENMTFNLLIFLTICSLLAHLKKPLEDYMSKFPKVKILRAEKREGLIKARLRGAEAATAPTLTFLDSHIECTPGWLEPLLDRIARNVTNVASPIIGIINDKNFEFQQLSSSNVQVGGFEWDLHFSWHMIPESEHKRRNNPAEPLRSPTIAGGLFTIDKAYFEILGTYDPDFDIWGGENLEISFKTWMCGGILEIVPCSQVGHVFRFV
jgi:Glycosyl transferase family 2